MTPDWVFTLAHILTINYANFSSSKTREAWEKVSWHYLCRRKERKKLRVDQKLMVRTEKVEEMLKILGKRISSFIFQLGLSARFQLKFQDFLFHGISLFIVSSSMNCFYCLVAFSRGFMHSFSDSPDDKLFPCIKARENLLSLFHSCEARWFTEKKIARLKKIRPDFWNDIDIRKWDISRRSQHRGNLLKVVKFLEAFYDFFFFVWTVKSFWIGG